MKTNARTLRRAVELAQRVSPTSGRAHDIAAGVLFQTKSTGIVMVSATDLDVSVMTVFKAEDTSEHSWRMPVGVLGPLLGKFKDDEEITLQANTAGGVTLTTESSSEFHFNTIDSGGFPDIEMPPTTPKVSAISLRDAAESVSWSIDSKSTGPLAGLHINGESLIGCSHSSLAVLPCPVALEQPVTFPPSVILPIVKGLPNTELVATATRLFVTWVDELVDDAAMRGFVSVGLITADYPNVMKIAREDFAFKYEVNRADLLTALDRLQLVTSQDRSIGRVKLTMPDADGDIRLDAEVSGAGDGNELVPVEVNVYLGDDGELGSEPYRSIKIDFSVDVLRQAVTRTNSADIITIKMGKAGDATKDSVSSARIDDDTGWFTIVMPMRPELGTTA